MSAATGTLAGTVTVPALEDVVALPAAPAAGSWTATTATPDPTQPDVEEGVDPDSVTPGVLGFLVTLFVVAVCIPLFMSMTRKVRRVQHRARVEAEAEAAGTEAAGADGTGSRTTGTGTTGAGTAGTGDAGTGNATDGGRADGAAGEDPRP